MQIHNLKRVHPNITNQLIGRGGKRGKTSGRGGKGQTARAGSKLRPEMRDFIKRLPKLRGRGKNIFTSIEEKPTTINLSDLNKAFENNDNVSVATLLEKGLVVISKGRNPKIKILSDGEITKSLNISGCLISAKAKEKIEKAGGKIT